MRYSRFRNLYFRFARRSFAQPQKERRLKSYLVSRGTQCTDVAKLELNISAYGERRMRRVAAQDLDQRRYSTVEAHHVDTAELMHLMAVGEP
jgi:hypothetical protein